MSLLDDLNEGERANDQADRLAGICQVCSALSLVEDDVTRDAIQRAVSGTIGTEKLAAILTRNGYPTGRRAIIRHRSEGHAT